MDIKIENYLSDEKIKEIVSDELRQQIRDYFKNESNANRLIINLSYDVVIEAVNEIVPNFHEILVEKTQRLINEKDLSFVLFNYDYSTGNPKSLAAKIIEQTVNQNKPLIQDNTVKAIHAINYEDKALKTLKRLSDEFASNIYEFIEIIRNKKP